MLALKDFIPTSRQKMLKDRDRKVGMRQRNAAGHEVVRVFRKEDLRSKKDRLAAFHSAILVDAGK